MAVLTEGCLEATESGMYTESEIVNEWIRAGVAKAARRSLFIVLKSRSNDAIPADVLETINAQTDVALLEDRIVTAAVLLAESHVCLHTWPEQRAVTVDVYVCNFGEDHSAKARGLMAALIQCHCRIWRSQKARLRSGRDPCISASPGRGRGER